MVTKNFKNMMKLVLQSSETSSTKGFLPAKKAIDGSTHYLCCKMRSTVFPGSVATNFSYTFSPGVIVGSGNTPPTEDDYKLDTQITSGLTQSGSTTVVYGADSDGNPYKQMDMILQNTTASDIVIREVGYLQWLEGSTVQYATTGNEQFPALLDRTLLETPLTVPANNVAVLRYVLKTII